MKEACIFYEMVINLVDLGFRTLSFSSPFHYRSSLTRYQSPFFIVCIFSSKILLMKICTKTPNTVVSYRYEVGALMFFWK